MLENRGSRPTSRRMKVSELLAHVTHARLTDGSKAGGWFAIRRTSAEWQRRLPAAQLDSEVIVVRDAYHGITLLKTVDGYDDVGRVELEDEGTLHAG